jgi:hypothetical protein
MKRPDINRLEEDMGRTEVIYEDSRTIAMDKREMERIYARRRRTEWKRRIAKTIVGILLFWKRSS